jgi:hypothetical protein
LPSLLISKTTSVPVHSVVFDKVKFGFRYMPYDFLARHKFSDLLGAAVKVLVVELKLSTEFIGATVDLL